MSTATACMQHCSTHSCRLLPLPSVGHTIRSRASRARPQLLSSATRSVQSELRDIRSPTHATHCPNPLYPLAGFPFRSCDRARPGKQETRADGRGNDMAAAARASTRRPRLRPRPGANASWTLELANRTCRGLVSACMTAPFPACRPAFDGVKTEINPTLKSHSAPSQQVRSRDTDLRISTLKLHNKLHSELAVQVEHMMALET